MKFLSIKRTLATVHLEYTMGIKDMPKPSLKIEELSPDERLNLLEELWESLRQDPSHVPLTPAQQQELDRRLDELESDVHQGKDLGIPWDVVLEQIRKHPR
jgi:putative addiction module component (TIGR02574 family)